MRVVAFTAAIAAVSNLVAAVSVPQPEAIAIKDFEASQFAKRQWGDQPPAKQIKKRQWGDQPPAKQIKKRQWGDQPPAKQIKKRQWGDQPPAKQIKRDVIEAA